MKWKFSILPAVGLLLAAGLFPLRAASLAGRFAPAPASAVVDLTDEGQLDWVHWGFLTEQTLIHKYGVAPQIQAGFIGGLYDGPYRLNDSPVVFSWSDGIPFSNVTNTTAGVFMLGLSHGFQLECPADASLKHLKIYLGAAAAQGTLTASLSGAPTYTDSSVVAPAGTTTNGTYTLDFQAGAPGQTLTVTFTMTASNAPQNADVALYAATLSGSVAPPVAVLSAPTNGAVFVAPATFSVTATAMDRDGVVTNLAILNEGTVLSETATSATANTFEFTLTNQTTNVFAFTARAMNDQGLTVTSAPVTVYVTSGGGTLLAGYAMPPATADLSAEGPLDWVHWGLTTASSVDRRSGTAPRISDLTLIAPKSAKLNQYGDNGTGYTWTNGIPTGAATNSTTGVFLDGLDNGFSITVPATNELLRLKVFVGLYGAQGRLDAWLGDGSVPPFSDDTLYSAYGNAYRVYLLTFAAPHPGTLLHVQWTAEQLFDPSYGNVTWQAATLGPPPPPPLLQATGPPAPDGWALQFNSEPGVSYQVLFSDTSAPFVWQPLTNVWGAAGSQLIQVPMTSDPQRFFKLEVQ
ncbi:MAG TPA: hypothetical protein VL527_03690 [Dongiaceae bacterium]|nr:hypothetical protein [Dongiaceae bacterium]